ncbi:MAG: translation initiation factor IF-2 [Peptococcaceae bacterium]|nr:translation initiation factor IF-2 [Peptococcaceae bacterium]
MAKVKVYELAKELNCDSKTVIQQLGKMGCVVKNHMSIIDEALAGKLREKFAAGEIKKTATGKNKQAEEKKPTGDGFVPRVVRIPKATAIEEAAALEENKEAVASEKGEVSLQAEEKKTTAAAEKETVAVAVSDAAEQNNRQPKAADGQKENLAPMKKEADKQPLPKEKTNQTPSMQAMQTMQTMQKDVKDNRQNDGMKRPAGEQAGRNTRPNNRFEQGGNRPVSSGDRRYQGQGGQGQNESKGKAFNNNNRPFNKDFAGKDKDGEDRNKSFHNNKGNNNRGPKPAGGTAGVMPGTKYTPAPVEKQANRKGDKKQYKDKEMGNNRRNSYGGDKEIRWKSNKKQKQAKQQMPPVVPKKIIIGETIIVQELAKSMGKTAAELIKKLFGLGVMVTVNQEIDSDTAILLGEEFGITVEVQVDKAMEIMEDVEDAADTLVERPPVVTVMGHVDHGKTSLLDAIREANVIATEAGGITQHIGAYQVEINNKKITFLDTPGHEAFTAMRARGAQITDVAILVVAADDGVMPQTIEAIDHAKAAGVPIIVAINKIDKPGANPDKVKQELTEYGLVGEDWGGDTIMVPISAKKRENIPQLLEMVLLVAEIAELKANPNRNARGTVIESQLDKGRGAVATLLVQKGTLHVGDNIIAGAVFGKVRAMMDDKGRRVKVATPSTPVEVLGFSEVPPAGEIFLSVEDEKSARMVASRQHAKRREDEMRKSSKVSLDDLFKQIEQGEIKELNVIIKADVHGSAEAVRQSLEKLATDEVKVTVIHSGVGAISESDVMLASSSNAIIIGFNVRPDANTKKAAEYEEVDIRLYRVIYDAIDDVKKAMAGLLAPEYKENVIGHAEVRMVIKVPKAGNVAGSYITDGKITRQAQVRVIRDGIVVTEGKIESLKRFKDDVKEVATGFECGIGIEDFNDVKEGDIIEAFVMEEIARQL